MKCKIEKLISHNEEAWIMRLPANAVADFVVLFAALHLRKVVSIQLVDKASDLTIGIYRQETKKKEAEYRIKLNSEVYPISGMNLKAIAACMTDVAINGWSDTAHIDIEINERKSLCFAVEPPMQ